MKKAKKSTVETEFKIKHIITAILCIMITLCIFGCGPSKEEQFKTLKTETLSILTELKTINRKAYDGWYMSGNPEHIYKADKKVNNRTPKITENLKKMEELSKDNKQMNNEYQEIKEDYNEMTKEWNSFHKAIKKRFNKE